MNILFSQLRTQPDINRHREQQQRDDAFQECGIELLHQKRAGQRAEKREQPGPPNLDKTQGASAGEVKRGAGGAKRGLQLVRAEAVSPVRNNSAMCHHSIISSQPINAAIRRKSARIYD